MCNRVERFTKTTPELVPYLTEITEIEKFLDILSDVFQPAGYKSECSAGILEDITDIRPVFGQFRNHIAP